MDIGNYPEALKNHFASLKIKEGLMDSAGIAASYMNIGMIYTNQGNYPDALKNQFAALKLYKEINEKRDIANSYNNIGNVYSYQGNYTEAIKNYFASLKIYEEFGDTYGMSTAYNNIVNIYEIQLNYQEALKNHMASLKIRQEIEDADGIATSYINLGTLYIKLNNIKEAETNLNKALKLSIEIGNKDDVKHSYAGLAVLDSTRGNFKAAFEHHKLFILYRDSLDNEETKKKTIQSSMTYEFEKKEIASKAEQEKLNAVTMEEKQKQNIVIFAVAGVLLLVIVFSLFLFKRFRITQRQKIIIEKQKVLVDNAYENLHEKNKEVLDSIYYARRIQRSLLTTENYIEKSLKRLRNT